MVQPLHAKSMGGLDDSHRHIQGVIWVLSPPLDKFKVKPPGQMILNTPLRTVYRFREYRDKSLK